MGSLTVGLFALTQSAEASMIGDLLMMAAIVFCGLGYAEGAALSRRLGGWQVISWALVLALPVMLLLALGRIAGVGQLQLLQPFFGLFLAGFLLHEPVALSMIGVTMFVVCWVAGAKRLA